MSDQQTFVKHADENNFEAMVLKADRPTLVDFWAPWCAPCRAIGPILEELAQSYGDQVNVVKVNVDESPTIAKRYMVRGIPTIMVFKDGLVKETQVGLAPKEHLRGLIDKNLSCGE